MPRHGLFALLALASLLIATALITTADAALPRSIGDVSHVNKSIQIADAGRAGELETVNGSIQVGNAASIESADTVNGAIRLGDGSHARALETVNGSITLGARAQIENGIETVNGSLNLGDDAEVLGSAENVNGSIVLKPRAHVGGTLSTYNGDITLNDHARVDAGIHVKQSKMSWFSGHARAPVIKIGPNASVGGDLVFEREVELYVHPSAHVGAIRGATAKPWPGAELAVEKN